MPRRAVLCGVKNRGKGPGIPGPFPVVRSRKEKGKERKKPAGQIGSVRKTVSVPVVMSAGTVLV